MGARRCAGGLVRARLATAERSRARSRGAPAAHATGALVPRAPKAQRLAVGVDAIH